MKRLFQVLAILVCLLLGVYARAERSGTYSIFDADLFLIGGEVEFYLDSNLSGVVDVMLAPGTSGIISPGFSIPMFTLGGGILDYFDPDHQGFYGAARVHLFMGIYPLLTPSVGFKYFVDPSVSLAIEGGGAITLSNPPIIPLVSIGIGVAY